jgi:hypothetical protein
MSKTLRWVLGILAVLVLIAVAAGAVWFWQNRSQMMASYRPYAVQPNAQGTPAAPNTQPGQNLPRGPQGFGDNRRFPMGGWDLRGPMMGGRPFRQAAPFMPFGMGLFFLGGLFRLVIPLAVLALVALLFYQLGKRAGASSKPVVAEAPKSEQDLPKSN